jgi:hypothetical protein
MDTSPAHETSAFNADASGINGSLQPKTFFEACIAMTSSRHFEPGKSVVLELGFGCGRGMAALSPFFPWVIGIEQQQDSGCTAIANLIELELAGEPLENIICLPGDILNLKSFGGIQFLFAFLDTRKITRKVVRLFLTDDDAKVLLFVTVEISYFREMLGPSLEGVCCQGSGNMSGSGSGHLWLQLEKSLTGEWESNCLARMDKQDEEHDEDDEDDEGKAAVLPEADSAATSQAKEHHHRRSTRNTPGADSVATSQVLE